MKKQLGIFIVGLLLLLTIPAAGSALEIVNGPTIYPVDVIYPSSAVTASATLYFPPKSFGIDDGIYLETDLDNAEWLVEIWGEENMYTSYEYYGNYVGVRGWSLYYSEKVWLKIMLRGNAPSKPLTSFSPIYIEEVGSGKNLKKFESGVLTVRPTPTPVPTMTPTPTPTVLANPTAIPMPSPEIIEDEDEGASLSQMVVVGIAGLFIGIILLVFIIAMVAKPKRRSR